MTGEKVLIVRSATDRFTKAVDLAKSKLLAVFIESNSVSSARDLLSRESVRAIVCDLDLPGGDAMSLFRHLEQSDVGETTFFMLDKSSRLSESDRDQMIVLQGTDEIDALWEHLEFIGIEVIK